MFGYKERGLLLAVMGLIATSSIGGQTSLKVEDLVQRHRDSIGNAAVRSAVKTRVMEGTATYQVVVGGSAATSGEGVFVSEGRKLHMLLKVAVRDYRGERFITDGEKTFIEATYDDRRSSDFAMLLHAEEMPLREGLLGGALSTAWPLLDLDGRRSKVKSLGRKKIDGRELEAVQYQPRKHSGLDATLYFEPDTFRHVLTIVTGQIDQTQAAPPTSATSGLAAPDNPLMAVGSSDEDEAARQQARYRIEERFENFRVVDGLTLPSHYELLFTVQLPSGSSKSILWDIKTTRVLNNVELDTKTFQLP